MNLQHDKMNMTSRFLLLAVLCLTMIAAPVSFAWANNNSGIAIVVNDDAISVNDLNDRLKLIMASSRLPDTQETRDHITPQIVNSLIEEQLKFQEGSRNDVHVSQNEINKGFATIAQQNNMELDQFKQALKQSGVNVGTIERQVKSQIMWSKVVAKRLRPQVKISENDINNVLDRFENSLGKEEYLVSEIELPVVNPQDEAKVKKLANSLKEQIESGQTNFFRVAQQFSSAPGAPQGGNLGWVQEGQLIQELDQAMKNLEIKSISNPIRSSGSYHLLYVRDKRTITDESVPSRDQISSSLGMSRLDRLQQRLLLDLKSSAFIENRLGS